jgi:hypothetical protein
MPTLTVDQLPIPEIIPPNELSIGLANSAFDEGEEIILESAYYPAANKIWRAIWFFDPFIRMDCYTTCYFRIKKKMQ